MRERIRVRGLRDPSAWLGRGAEITAESTGGKDFGDVKNLEGQGLSSGQAFQVEKARDVR